MTRRISSRLCPWRNLRARMRLWSRTLRKLDTSSSSTPSTRAASRSRLQARQAAGCSQCLRPRRSRPACASSTASGCAGKPRDMAHFRKTSAGQCLQCACAFAASDCRSAASGADHRTPPGAGAPLACPQVLAQLDGKLSPGRNPSAGIRSLPARRLCRNCLAQCSPRAANRECMSAIHLPPVNARHRLPPPDRQAVGSGIEAGVRGPFRCLQKDCDSPDRRPWLRLAAKG